MYFGVLGDQLRKCPDSNSEEEWIQCVACQDDHPGEYEDKVVI